MNDLVRPSEVRRPIGYSRKYLLVWCFFVLCSVVGLALCGYLFGWRSMLTYSSEGVKHELDGTWYYDASITNTGEDAVTAYASFMGSPLSTFQGSKSKYDGSIGTPLYFALTIDILPGQTRDLRGAGNGRAPYRVDVSTKSGEYAYHETKFGNRMLWRALFILSGVVLLILLFLSSKFLERDRPMPRSQGTIDWLVTSVPLAVWPTLGSVVLVMAKVLVEFLRGK